MTQATATQQGMLFGEIAVREGLTAGESVQACLEIQQKLRSFGVVPKRIGEIMIEKGYLDQNGVNRILEVQQHRQQTLAIPGYEIQELIGKGGMGGQVYKARQVSLDRIVALKVLPPRYAKDRTFRERFISEARAVARLNHENIIAGIDVGEVNGYCYFVMEYVEGDTVAELVEARGAIEEKRALRITLQVAAALTHAAKHGLVHRDVKPQNILVANHDIAKLCDLGLAKVAEGDDGEADRKGIPIGTPHYISPEQARGESDVDIRSDIYSLGATVYHMLTGETPFVGSSPMVLMTKHLTEDPEPPKRRNPKVSRASSDLVLYLMEKRREDRPQSPEELTDEIERALDGKRPAGAPKRGGGGGGGSGREARTSGANARRREKPSASLSAYIDPEAQERRERARRIRAVRIRGAKQTESVSLAVAIFGAVAVLIIIIVAVIFRPEIKPGAPPQDEERAVLLLKKAAGHKGRGEYDEARREYENVIRLAPSSQWARIAESHLADMGSAGGS